MSLIGIDIGSSAVKVAAYTEEGNPLGIESEELSPLHPGPGMWETDPEDIWRTMTCAVQRLAAQPSLLHDPPSALAVSASGRENFPANKDGKPLGNGIMGADVRGLKYETPPKGNPNPESWCLRCGHNRERMDPVFRLAWWNENHPEIMQRAKYFFGWIDFIHFRLTGRDIIDESTASRYAVFDIISRKWDSDSIEFHKMQASLLPDILPWGSIIGKINSNIASDWGLPKDVLVAQGGHDVNCATLGSGVDEQGTACLISGSYENLLVPIQKGPTRKLLKSGLSVMPHPGRTGLLALAVHPTGNAVLNWIRHLLGISISQCEVKLLEHTTSPSPVMAIPFLSGSMTFWEDGRKLRGSLLNLSLSTSDSDIIQAFMESIAYDTLITLKLFESDGININRLRVTGGGARSEWWNQLKADISGIPIEVVKHNETGTLGAAILAGYASGAFSNPGRAGKELSCSMKTYYPNSQRGNLHKNKLESYQKIIKELLLNVY
jgi:xylulokinase